METLNSIGYWLCWWLFRPFLWWARYRTAPAELSAGLQLDPQKPVCFVLPLRSWIDLFALQKICREAGLAAPRPSQFELPRVGRPAILYLPALLERRSETEALEALMQKAVADPAYDVQLVPVSVFWGRDPEKETSLFKLLFADSVQAGRLRKLFISVVQGRNVFANFGQPLAFKRFMGGERDPRRAMRKLARIFNIHFLRARSATLGPELVRRQTVLRGLLAAPAVKLAIEREAKDKNQTLEQAGKRARKLAEEIAADYSTASINFLERVITQVLNRVFKGLDVRGIERVRSLAETHEVLYLPSHRSHFDYLLLSYVLYRGGLVPPHIAAGVNLNFWPVGGLLRRCGAFYMRRSFSGDPLYTAIFRAYVDALISRGYSISFYPEGGRSRTGRLLPPKTGLMAMVTESALRQRVRKVVVVPVYLGYDRLMEAGSYFKELRGGQKQKESAQGLFKATRILTKSFGRAYINFGEPIRVQDFADQHLPAWREGFGSDIEPQKPEGFKRAVTLLSQETMRRINSAVVAYPVALIACAVLASPQKVVGERELATLLDHLVRLLQGRPYSADQHIPRTEPRDIIDWAAPIARLSRIPHPWGDLLLAEDRNATLLTYYRNNVQHLFALPSLIANFFRARLQLSEEAIVTGCRALYPFLRTEFFLATAPEACEQATREWIQQMLELGLLERGDSHHLQRPKADSSAYASLAMLARIMGETLERYSMTTLMLAAERKTGAIARAGFEKDCQLLAERTAVLTGRMAPEFFDKALFRGYVDTLIELGVVTEDEHQVLKVDERIDRIADRSLELLGADVQQTILQVLSSRGNAPVNPV